MAIHTAPRGSFTRPNQQTQQVTNVPAPTRGIDARQNLSDPEPKVCIYAFNMEPSEFGMQVRKGYREYQAGIVDSTSLGVRTIIPYAGDETDDRLFAVTQEGIWDVTVDGAAPIQKLAFGSTVSPAGFGVYTAYTTDAGDNILFYADRENGLFIYDPDLDTWAAAAGITGITIADITYVSVHKQRIWLAVKNDTTGYYLAPGAIAGAVTAFYFGAKFKHGGELVAVLNWSVDGGTGLDDYLVAVSRAGDVIPYQGDDPALDSWQNVGTYFIGALPAGNKIASDFGGELLLLSEFGITSMGDLLQASEARSPAAESISFKVARLLRADLQSLKNQEGWQLHYAATQGYLIVCTPKRANYPHLQYVLIRTTEGWCFWRSVPMICVDSWRGETYFGTADNTVEVMDVDLDNTDNDNVAAGEPINFSLLTSFSHLGQPGRFKRGEFTRPTFIGAAIPVFRTRLLYDYKRPEILPPAAPFTPANNLWDVALWDLAFWSGGASDSHWSVRGGLGIGRTIAIAINGYSGSPTILVDIDLMWRTGGVL